MSTESEIQLTGEAELVTLRQRVQALEAALAERDQMLASLRRTEAQARALIENMPATTYVVALDGEDTPVYISPQIEALLGFTPTQWQADPTLWYRQLHPEDRDQVMRDIYQSQYSGEPLCSEYRLFTTKGKAVWVHDRAVTLRDEHGKPNFVQGLFLNITRRKEAEAEFARSRQRLEELMQKRTIEMVRANEQLRQEIVEHEQTEMMLRYSEFKFRTIVNCTWDWEFWLNPERKFFYISPSCERISGYKAYDFLVYNSLFSIIIHPADKQLFQAKLDTAFKQETEIGFEFRIVRKDKEVRWVSMGFRPIIDDDNQNAFLGVRGTIRDITESKEAAEALRKSEERFRVAAERASDLIYEWDFATGQVIWSGRIELYVDSEASELAENTKFWQQSVHPDDCRRIAAARKHHFKTNEPFEECYRIRGKNGIFLDWVERGIALRDETGKPYKWIGVISDVTQRNRVEAELREIGLIFNELANNVHEVFWILDAKNCSVTYVSPAYETIFGRSCTSFYSNPRSFLDLVHPADRERMTLAFEEQKQGKLFDGECRIVSPNGAIRSIWIRTSPILNEQNEVYRFAGVVEDITVRKQAEEDQLRLHQEVIEVQAETLRQLSTPLIPISAGVLVMPLIGVVDSKRAEHVLTTLLEGVVASCAKVAILDITALSVIDEQVAKTLLQVAQAVRLLGAQVILTGIRPSAAQTLVALGIDLRGLVTRSTLQEGVAYAMKR